MPLLRRRVFPKTRTTTRRTTARPTVRLTVAQVLPALEEGGVERGAIDTAKALRQAGHRAILISAGGKMAEELQETGVETKNWEIGRKHPKTLSYIPKLRRYLREEHIDILHARSRLPAWICEQALRGLHDKERPRYLTTVHGAYSVNAYSAVMTRGECVIAVSEFIKEYIHTNYPKAKNRTKTIHNGVDPKQYPRNHQPDKAWIKRWREKTQIKEQDFLITLPARLSQRKGHEDLIKILKQLREQGIPAQALAAGKHNKTRYLNKIKEQAKQAKVQQALHLPGNCQDLREIMAFSQAILSLSKEPEAFGRSVLEALYLGKPVIAYHHGGVKEIMNKLFPWGAIPPGDWRAAAQKLAELHKNPTHPQHQPKTQTPYTNEKNHAQTIALYEELASKTANL